MVELNFQPGDYVRLRLALKEVEGSGGGHEDAVGARIKAIDLEKFKETIEKEVG